MPLQGGGSGSPSLTGTAAAAVYTGACGDNVTYTLDTDKGTLVISGTGAMTAYDYSNNVPWFGYRSYVKTATISNGVTTISNYCFREHTNMTSVSIPSSVTSIGAFAFWYCLKLTAVTVPDGITYIRNGTFHTCRSLRSVTLPQSVIGLYYYAFMDCSSLQSITLPNGLQHIQDMAFQGCISLESINLPNGLIEIGDQAFYGCDALRTLVIPPSVATGSSIYHIRYATKFLWENAGGKGKTVYVSWSSIPRCPNDAINVVENGKSTLVVPCGHNPYYERQGWGTYFNIVNDPLTITAASADEAMGSVSVKKVE